MSLDVDVTTNGVRSPLEPRRASSTIARSALRGERVRNALVSITLLDRRAIARLNAKHLGHRGPTDVISFGFTRATPTRSGHRRHLHLSVDVAREQRGATARAACDEELARLVVHGMLHVLGHDHPEDDDARALADVAAAGDDRASRSASEDAPMTQLGPGSSAIVAALIADVARRRPTARCSPFTRRKRRRVRPSAAFADRERLHRALSMGRVLAYIAAGAALAQALQLASLPIVPRVVVTSVHRRHRRASSREGVGRAIGYAIAGVDVRAPVADDARSSDSR